MLADAPVPLAGAVILLGTERGNLLVHPFLGRYGHLAPEHLRTAVARLDAALPVPAKLSAQTSAQEGVTEGALLSK